MDGDFVEPPQSLWLRYAVLDHHGVEVFHVRQADQVIDVGIVSLVAFEVWMRELPLLMRLPEKRNVQHVRLVRVDDAHLGARNHRRDEVLLNRVRVDTIIDFRQLALGRPSQLCLLRRLEPLESLDQIQLKFNREPRRRLPHHHNPVVYYHVRRRPRRVDAAAAVPVRLADDAETPGHFALNPCAISLVQSFDPSLTAMTSSRFSVSASRMRTPYWILSTAASTSWRVLESNARPMAMMGNPRARYGSA